ncbi:hypothetical protein [Cellulosilyticum ruminicola]|uniref:hypothetical protein n=1 Tax=Cellulosilyticum ruminicola TaxID=425254 RepID=UPI0012ECFE6D|nr:hypothetical protein [Cellulosilyticum ruminicola]
MKDLGNKIITRVLYAIIIVFFIEIIQTGYHYYKGPIWAAENYVKAVEKGEYERAYKSLSYDSLNQDVDAQKMIAYYGQTYKKLLQAQLVGKVQFKGSNKAVCKAVYTYGNKNEEVQLELVRSQKRWEIINPFKSESITIYAPSMAKVYINGQRLTDRQDGKFVGSGFLPGEYVLQVIMPKKEYKNYTQMLKVPEQKEVIVPYDMMSVSVKTVRGMEVSLDRLSKKVNKSKVTFGDLLPGEYTLCIKSPYKVITPIIEQVTIDNKSCNLNFEELTLSEEGEEKWHTFIEDFYKDYLKGIKLKEDTIVANYFEARMRNEQRKLYNDWFIANKDVQDANMHIEANFGKVKANGCLQSEVVEVIELTNLEEVEGSKENRVYRLVLKWDMAINVVSERWQIINRTLKESIVAYKSEEGKWIQY